MTGLVYVYIMANQDDKDKETDRQSQKLKNGSTGKGNGCCSSFVNNPDRTERFESLADRYDALIGWGKLLLSFMILS